jgi:hypothetical protein
LAHSLIEPAKKFGNYECSDLVIIKDMAESIDTIKRRMIMNASKIWGYHDVQDINSFDPVLGLIIGALAEEIYNISGKIDESEVRLVDKFLDIIYGQNHFNSIVAHAVATAKPVQPRSILKNQSRFYFIKYIQSKIEGAEKVLKRNIYFTPTVNTVLFNGQVKFIFAGKHLFEVEGQEKQLLAEASAGIPFNRSKFIIGIRMDPSVDDLDGLSLFFSFKNLQVPDHFYQSLRYAQWKINGLEAKFSNGPGQSGASNNDSFTDNLNITTNVSFRNCSYVNEYYGDKFMTLQGSNVQKRYFLQNGNIPGMLSQLLGQKIFNENILWIEIDLSQPLSAVEIDDLIVSMNCFPIINRELNENVFNVVKGTNIIPLATNDLFLDIENVVDSKNQSYEPLGSLNHKLIDDYTYVLREGGISRFSPRDARESIKHLIDLTRDESAAFAVEGGSHVSFELKQLDQIISRLQQRMNTSESPNGLNYYLILKSGTDYDKLNVRFWSTTGALANNIRPGTRLSFYRGIDVDENSVILISQTTGGKSKLSKDEKLNSLRRGLLSKGRIVTVEDVKAACYECFGSGLTKVEVKKGVGLGSLPNKGMIRTIDVHLTLKKGFDLSEDIYQKTESFKSRLKNESMNLFPYRIFTSYV